MEEKVRSAARILFELALAEDIGDGDITTNNFIPKGETKTARFVAKENGIVAGLPIAKMVFEEFDANLKWDEKLPDGSQVNKGDVIVEFSANYRALLSGERIALNFVQRMSGVATYSNRCVKETAGYKVKILDTRKTLPAYRLLDKYSVKMGGATNHRMGLYDMVMIKDNHIKIAGGIKNAVEAIREKIAVSIKIEVETTNIKQVQEAIAAGADIIMLDNMDTGTMKECVKIINRRAKVEASGNMAISRIKEVAATGVDFISIGGLTHSVNALDISQRIID